MQMFAMRKVPVNGNLRDLRFEGRGLTEAGLVTEPVCVRLGCLARCVAQP
jgi:hypothetical protein